jgi:hypothetical protein
VFEIRIQQRSRLEFVKFGEVASSLLPQQGFAQTTSTPNGSSTEASSSPNATPGNASKPGPQTSLGTINLRGTGNAIYLATGCDPNPATCDHNALGTLGDISKGGSLQANFSVQWSDPHPNGAGGLCTPAAETIEFALNRTSNVSATLLGLIAKLRLVNPWPVRMGLVHRYPAKPRPINPSDCALLRQLIEPPVGNKRTSRVHNGSVR